MKARCVLYLEKEMAVIEILQENVPIYDHNLLYGNFKKQFVPLW